MANYADSVLLEARRIQQAKYATQFEGRPLNSFIMDGFLKDRDIVIPSLGQIKQAETQATTILYLKKPTFSLGSAKSCAPSGSNGDSGYVTPTWYTKTAIAYISEKLHDGNEIKMAEALAWQLLMAEQALFKDNASSMEAVLAAYLAANRTQVAEDEDVHATWDGTNYNYYLAVAAINNFYNYALDDLARNNYQGGFLDFYNTSWGGAIRVQQNNGQQNATNLAFQYNTPFNFMGYASNLLTNGTSDLTTHYLVPEGGVALIDWNSPRNREGKTIGGKSWGLYQSRLFPGLMLDLFTVSDCDDTSGAGGAKQDIVHTYELAFNYCIVKQPLSTSGETPIIKYVMRTT